MLCRSISIPTIRKPDPPRQPCGKRARGRTGRRRNPGSRSPARARRASSTPTRRSSCSGSAARRRWRQSKPGKASPARIRAGRATARSCRCARTPARISMPSMTVQAFRSSTRQWAARRSFPARAPTWSRTSSVTACSTPCAPTSSTSIFSKWAPFTRPSATAWRC